MSQISMPAAKTVAPAQNSSRQAVLDAAACVFSEKGFAATSIRDIAKASGIRSASLYYHFPSKDEIFYEVMKIGVESVFDAVRRAVETVPAEATHLERIRRAMSAHLYSALEWGPYTKVNIRCASQILDEEGRKRNADVRRPYESYWRELIRQGIAAREIGAEVDVTLCSLYIFGFMNWTVEWYRPQRFSIDLIVDQYVQFLFGGIAPSSSSYAHSAALQAGKVGGKRSNPALKPKQGRKP